MLNFIPTPGAYPSEVVAVMVEAFDRTCESLPKSEAESPDMRRKLAWIIISFVDRGEGDPAQLCELAKKALASQNSDDDNLDGTRTLR